jgi:hypothetical protein
LDPRAVILIGLQGAGKTTFYQQRFAATHLRISQDQLKTRTRALAAFEAAAAKQQPLVVDNTNATVEQRASYIARALASGYRIEGYYFEPDIQGCLKRNALRSGKERVPVAGLFGTRKRLQPPSFAEGFDALYTVEVIPEGAFRVRPWLVPAAEVNSA